MYRNRDSSVIRYTVLVVTCVFVLLASATLQAATTVYMALGSGFSVTDMNQNRMVREVRTAAAPNSVLVSKDGKRAYVSNIGPGVHGVALSDDGKTLFASEKKGNRQQPLIWVVDQRSLTLLGQIKLGTGEGHQAVVVDE